MCRPRLPLCPRRPRASARAARSAGGARDTRARPSAGVRASVRAIVCATVCATLTLTTAAAQDDDDRPSHLDKSQRRVTELFEIRLGLLLDDLIAHAPVDEPAVETLRTASKDAVATFMEANPVKHAPQGNVFFGSVPPVSHEPFTALLESEAWRAACASSLSADDRKALDERMRLRNTRVREALEDLLERRIAYGLCLAPEEREGLAPVVDAVADTVIEGGLVTANVYYYYNQPEDELPGLLDQADVDGWLAPERQKIFKELGKGERTALHDFQCEVEFFLRVTGGDAATRRVLEGCAKALVQRGAANQRGNRGRGPFVPGRDLAEVDFWNKALRTALDLEEGASLPEAPSRSNEAVIEARSEYLLAIVDERAYLSDEQYESLLPLMRKFVEDEFEHRRRSCNEMRLPAVFGFSREGLLIGSNSFNRPSVKTKSIIDTVIEVCTEEQREALGV